MGGSFFLIYNCVSLLACVSFMLNKCIVDETVTIIKAAKTKNDICIPPFYIFPNTILLYISYTFLKTFTKSFLIW